MAPGSTTRLVNVGLASLLPLLVDEYAEGAPRSFLSIAVGGTWIDILDSGGDGFVDEGIGRGGVQLELGGGDRE